jgi:hypothetical protein
MNIVLALSSGAWAGIGVAVAVLWIVLMIFFGIRTLRNRHGWLFFFGIFFPLLWIIGAFMTPSPESSTY